MHAPWVRQAMESPTTRRRCSGRWTPREKSAAGFFFRRVFISHGNYMCGPARRWSAFQRGTTAAPAELYCGWQAAKWLAF